MFNIDVETCRACGGSAKVIACIEDPVIIRKMLNHLQMNADHQGSAPSFEEDSGVLGVKKELNCVPILLGLMQKGVYLSCTPEGSTLSS